MINLLPPEVKVSYRYARRNSRLIHWLVAFSLALAGLAALSIGGILYLHRTATGYENQAAVSQDSLRKQKQADTEKQVTSISNDLKLTVQVLSNQVLYSQLLKQLATIIPSDSALANLSISQVQGALDITANTADYGSATQLQVNLADPANKIFSKADIININCGGSKDGVAARYPCAVTVRALFAANNPYLFAAATGTKAVKK